MASAAEPHTFPQLAKRAVADTQLRRNIGNATQTIRTKRAASSPRCRIKSCARPAAPEGAHAAQPGPLPGPVGGGGDQGRRAGPLGARRRRGQAHRHRDRQTPLRQGGDQGQVDHDRGDQAERGAGGRRYPTIRDRPGRIDHPARRRRLLPHPGARDPPQPRRDPRTVHEKAGVGRAVGSPVRPDCRGADISAREVPDRAHGGQRGQFRHLRHGHHLRRGVGGTAACA